MAALKVLYVYASNRKEIFELHARGEAPESFLYFFPSLQKLGLNVRYNESLAPGLLSRVVYPLQKLAIRFTGAGFKLDEALNLLPEVLRSDAVVATTDSTALPLLLLKKLGVIRVPVIVFTIGLYDTMAARGPSKPFVRAYSELYRHADRIVSFSGQVQLEKLGKLLGLRADQLVSVPLCIDTHFYRPAAVKQDDFIISIGRDPQRDYKSLFRVAEKTACRFKVLTSPHVLKGLAVPPNVEVLYDHPMRATADEICKSRFYFHLSRPNSYFAGHTTLLAAMACGKLAVFNDSAPDLPFRDMENCVIVRDAEDAVIKLRHLLASPLDVARIAHAGYQLVTTHFPASAAALQLKNVIESVSEQPVSS